MNITLNDDAEYYLKSEAARLGISVDAYCQSVLEKEAKRLFYIERSQPKDKRPPGRPTISSDVKKCRELAAKIMPMYIRKKEQFAMDMAAYEKFYGEQEEKLKKAVENNDLQTLLWFDRVQPWVKRHVTNPA